MASGPILPSSVFLGNGAGNIYPQFYIPAFGGIGSNGVGHARRASASSPRLPQMPPPFSNSTCRKSYHQGSSISAASPWPTLQAASPEAHGQGRSHPRWIEHQSRHAHHRNSWLSQTWATIDILVENKIALSTTPQANDIYTVVATFNTTGWTLAQPSVWQFSLVWE